MDRKGNRASKLRLASLACGPYQVSQQLFLRGSLSKSGRTEPTGFLHAFAQLGIPLRGLGTGLAEPPDIAARNHGIRML